MKHAPSPRISGLALRIVTGALRAPLLGPALRRSIGASRVEARLAHVDFAAEGSPAPMYTPPAWAPSRAGEDGA